MKLSRQPLKRPLLFQVSKGVEPTLHRAQKSKSITAPALGRVAPVDVREDNTFPKISVQIDPGFYEDDDTSSTETPDSAQAEGQSIFWRLALMEFQEAAVLLLLNWGVAYVVNWQLKSTFQQTYADFWSFLASLHFLISWAYFMLPIVLTGSSVVMLRKGFGIADIQPEKRISFSLFMLVSVTLFPLSFLCMILTPAHTTLAELLTGQEIRERTPDLLRR
jgi:hypothetical protein